jgi:hypothetical protein
MLRARRSRSSSTACATLYDASPFVAVAAALNEFKDSIQGLRHFEIQPGPAGAAGAAAEESGDAPAALVLEGQIKRMETELDSLAKGVRALPHADVLNGHLANLKGHIAALEDYQYATVHRRLAGGDETTEDNAAGKLAEIAPVVGRTASAAASETTGPKSPSDGISGSPNVAEQERAEAEKEAGTEGGASADGRPIDVLQDSVASMESALRAAFPEFSLFSTVSGHVQMMRDQAHAFDRVTGSDYGGATDGPVDRETAEERFDQTREQLSKGIDQVETALQGRTRVITLANVIRSNPELSAAGAAAMARSILHDFDALERFLPILMPLQWVASADSAIARIGIAPKRLATLSTDSIQTIYIFMIGAIGSLIYITKYHLKLAIQGNWLGSAPTRPLPWLLFRPFFGIVVAFAVYLLVRAGQFAFGNGTEDGVGTDLNIPILSVVALFAGLLAWQALEAIETRGRLWFSSQTRKPLWASGLDHALRTSGRTIAECSHQIGRSTEQVERWLLFRDMVPVELQDRIATWLNKPLAELFGENKPVEELGGRPMWAVGLKAALDSRERRLDEEGLAELLHEEKRADNLERIRKWINLKLQVSPAMQWQLVDLLEVPHSKLFAAALQDRNVWALHLRRTIESRRESARKVAERLALDVETIHAWKELEVPVPTAAQDRLISTLDRSFTELFEPEPKEDDWLILANGLGQAIERKYGKPDLEAFAAEVDVDVARVQDWIERRKPVALDSRAKILKVLGPSPDLFSPPKIGP